MAKWSSLNRKEIIKEEILGHERTQYAKIWIKSIGLPSFFEFSKLCLMIEAKVTMLMILNVYKEDTEVNEIRNREGKGM